MDSEEDAKDTAQALRSLKRMFRGQAVKARIKTEQVVRSYFPVQPPAVGALPPPLFPMMPFPPMMTPPVPIDMMGFPFMGMPPVPDPNMVLPVDGFNPAVPVGPGIDAAGIADGSEAIGAKNASGEANASAGDDGNADNKPRSAKSGDSNRNTGAGNATKPDGPRRVRPFFLRCFYGDFFY